MDVATPVMSVVEQLRRENGAHIDVSVGQGRDAVRKKLQERLGERVAEPVLDKALSEIQKALAELAQRLRPYELPQDYLFFLEYYGGLFLESGAHYFAVLGVGPMVEEWYAAIDSDSAIPELVKYDFLQVGTLSFRAETYQFQRVSFVLDLAGTIQKHAIIGIGPWGHGGITPLDVVRNPREFTGAWQLSAKSFTSWLSQAAATKGAFGYEI